MTTGLVPLLLIALPAKPTNRLLPNYALYFWDLAECLCLILLLKCLSFLKPWGWLQSASGMQASIPAGQPLLSQSTGSLYEARGRHWWEEDVARSYKWNTGPDEFELDICTRQCYNILRWPVQSYSYRNLKKISNLEIGIQNVRYLYLLLNLL